MVALVEQVLARGLPQSAPEAEFIWGSALSIEGADLQGAADHLGKAGELLRAQGEGADLAMCAAVSFELGSIAAQQGDLDAAIAHYHTTLAIAQNIQLDAPRPFDILAYNNLAYHLLLQGDDSARGYAETGLELARQKGALMFLPFLLSTRGEIALAEEDLETAAKLFTEGLALAERLNLPERIAGLTANLGLVAMRRDETTRAIYLLSTALAQADALGTQHLAAQIRLWLVPLLPPDEARVRLAEARAIAEHGGRRRLLAEVELLEQEMMRNRHHARHAEI
jgi:tetratricopeptide (TPR) repeat protein